jgi:hypothetical protein
LVAPCLVKKKIGFSKNSPWNFLESVVYLIEMRVLVACEFSGIVRDAFRKRSHDAVSCDLLPSECPGPHIQGDVFEHLDDGWDMMIFFWPCTNMAVSGARWFHLKRAEQARDVECFIRLAECKIPKTAGENPVGVLSTQYRKPDQIIQPWQFGHGETKATCIWLKGLPKLVPTDIVPGREPRVHYASPGPDRWKFRSRTLPGIADAMAEQWGGCP